MLLWRRKQLCNPRREVLADNVELASELMGARKIDDDLYKMVE